MKQTGLSSRPWRIVPVCAAMHITFAIGLLIDPKVGLITALHFASLMFGDWVWAFVLFCGLTAVVPMTFLLPARLIHICLWPQQFMLFLMASSVLQATLLGTYPDGYKAPPVFILTDQCYVIYLTLAHVAVLIRNARYQ